MFTSCQHIQQFSQILKFMSCLKSSCMYGTVLVYFFNPFLPAKWSYNLIYFKISHKVYTPKSCLLLFLVGSRVPVFIFWPYMFFKCFWVLDFFFKTCIFIRTLNISGYSPRIISRSCPFTHEEQLGLHRTLSPQHFALNKHNPTILVLQKRYYPPSVCWLPLERIVFCFLPKY